MYRINRAQRTITFISEGGRIPLMDLVAGINEVWKLSQENHWHYTVYTDLTDQRGHIEAFYAKTWQDEPDGTGRVFAILGRDTYGLLQMAEAGPFCVIHIPGVLKKLDEHHVAIAAEYWPHRLTLAKLVWGLGDVIPVAGRLAGVADYHQWENIPTIHQFLMTANRRPKTAYDIVKKLIELFGERIGTAIGKEISKEAR